MTDERIKQNAESYTEAHTLLGAGEADKVLVKNAYISGAHSRDREVKELQNKNVEYFKLAEYWKKRARRLSNRLLKKGEQIAELKKGE